MALSLGSCMKEYRTEIEEEIYAKEGDSNAGLHINQWIDSDGSERIDRFPEGTVEGESAGFVSDIRAGD